MTAEALSSLNSMQSLRERLIQEGSVVPAESVEELRDTLNRRICKIVDLGKGLDNEMFGIYSLIVVRSIGGFCKFESECFGKKILYVQLLRLSLLINKFSEFFKEIKCWYLSSRLMSVAEAFTSKSWSKNVLVT